MIVSRLLVLILFVCIFAATGIVAAQQPPGNSCPDLFCIGDAYNTTGNQTIKVCAGTSQTVWGLNFWFNGTGPFNVTAVGAFSIPSATYESGVPYNDNFGLVNASINATRTCAIFVLNGTNATFATVPVQLNITIYNRTSFATAAAECLVNGCNGTMMTLNYVSLMARTPVSTPIANFVFMLFNNITKSYISQGPAMTDGSGYFAQHCSGVLNGTVCRNYTSIPPYNESNQCITRGAPFPSQSDGCQINSTISFTGFDFISSNATIVTNVSPGTPITVTPANPAAVGFVMPSIFSSSPGFGQSPNVTNVTVIDAYTGALVYTSEPSDSSEGPKGGPPFFLTPNQFYNITIKGPVIGNLTYPFLAPSAGMTGADIAIANSSGSMTTFIGKVLNETGAAMPNTIVYVQVFRGGGGAFGISFINSSVTDSNGRFSVKVPSTQFLSGFGMPFPYPVYQFYLISNSTSGDVPRYFPTVDNNNNRGYFAQGTTAVLSPLTIKAGGRVDVTVTLNNASLVLSELSKFATLGTGLGRSAVTGKATMISIFTGIVPPASLVISLLSPVDTVFYNLFGKNSTFGGPGMGSSSIVSVCAKNVTVTQGVASSTGCTLISPGFLNLSVTTFNDIFTPVGGITEQVGGFNFWFDTTAVVRNTSGSITLYANTQGIFLQDMLGFGTNPTSSLAIPLPPGNYTLELRSDNEFTRYLGVLNISVFEVLTNVTTNITVRRGNVWRIEPRFPNSLVLTGNNSLQVVVNREGGTSLNNSHVTLHGKVLYPNKTLASATPITFLYNDTLPGGAHFRGIFNAQTLQLDAGKYLLFLTATNVTNSTNGINYTATTTVPINLFDFVVSADLGGSVFGTGQVVTGKLFAFNATGPVAVNTSPIVVSVFDSAGTPVTVTATPTNISNGEGTLNITMPSAVGFYTLVVKVNASNSFGVAERWFQVSNLNVKIATDRQNYQPSDTVQVSVQVLNASNNAGYANTSIEVVVDNGNTPATGITDASGKAVISLAPATYASTGNWTFGFHNLRVKISRDTGTDVVKFESYAGFDVRGMDLFIRTTKPAYQATDPVILEALGPSGMTISSLLVDGATLTSSASAVTNVSYNLTLSPSGLLINLSNWTVGRHNVKITATVAGGSQTFFTGFDVNAYVIKLLVPSFSYRLNDLIPVNVSVSYPNGTAVGSASVLFQLFKAQPPNDIQVSNATVTTTVNGTGNATLNASRGGFNYIKVTVTGQSQFMGVSVSSFNLTMLNQAGGTAVTNYNGAPGSTVVIAVTTSPAVADGSSVSATLWAFGNPVNLPSNTTTGGNATISFLIPSFAPAQVYGLETRITTPSGDQGFARGTLTVTGGSALQIKALTNRRLYRPGDTAVLTALLTYPNATGVSGSNITFEIGSEGSRPQVAGTALTGSAGSASVSTSITANFTDGEYFLHVYLSNSSDIQHYTGFQVSSVNVVVNTSRRNYAPGDQIQLFVQVFNGTTGASLTATSGSVFIFTPKGEIKQSFEPTGSQPYQVNVSVPNESSVLGTYPIEVVMSVGKFRGSGFTMVNIVGASQSLNITVPAITAGTPFFVNLTSTANGTASLTVFSPSAASIAYSNTSVNVSNQNASVNVTISTPGLYVFQAFQTGVGPATAIATVTASGTAPSIWSGTSLSANATNFTTSQDVYLMTSTANATAQVISFDSATNTTFAVDLSLNQLSGTTYFGIFNSSSLVSGRKYFARLDTSLAAAVAKTIFKVL